MPTTPNYGFRYPSSTDPPEVPVHIQNLAVDVEAEMLDVQTRIGRSFSTIAAANAAGLGVAGNIIYHTGLKRNIYHNGSGWDVPYDVTPAADWMITTDQALGTGVSTLLTWPTANITPVGISTAAGVQTIAHAGLWSIDLSVRFTNSGGNYTIIGGASAVTAYSKDSSSTLNSNTSVTRRFAAASTFRCYAYCGSGGSASKENAGDQVTGLRATWIAP